MPRIKFTAETMPKSSAEFQRVLREAWENASPLDDLIELTRDLVVMERQYGMDSVQFYEQFQRGEMGDDLDYFDWATRYEMYCQAKEEVEQALGDAEARIVRKDEILAYEKALEAARRIQRRGTFAREARRKLIYGSSFSPTCPRAYERARRY